MSAGSDWTTSAVAPEAGDYFADHADSMFGFPLGMVDDYACSMELPSDAGSGDGSDIPVAIKIQGDPDEIEGVLDKLRDLAGPDAAVLESDKDGDTIVIGPNADYRAEVLKDGGLGDDDVFQDVVREADQAHTVLFVNVNELEDAIKDVAGESDAELVENLEPIAGFGVTGWVDGDVAHAVARLTTD